MANIMLNHMQNNQFDAKNCAQLLHQTKLHVNVKQKTTIYLEKNLGNVHLDLQNCSKL